MKVATTNMAMITSVAAFIVISAEEILIDSQNSAGGRIIRFWTCTGFSPTPSGNGSMGTLAEFLLSKDEQLNLAYIGALPNDGITHVRIHWLLNLIKADCSPSGSWKFDFQELDRLVERMGKLSLGFELMGNPSGCFSGKWTRHEKDWFSMMRQILERYKMVSGKWRFETFNEPDLKMFNVLKLNLNEFLHYVKLTAQTLSDFNLTLWGPAGLFKDESNHPLCWGLVNYCRIKTCPVQVLSFHKKGDGHASSVVDKSQDFINVIRNKHLGGISFANDEADPLAGWIHPVGWRGDVRYAAAVVQTIIGLTEGSVSNNYSLLSLSNDNAFLSYWPNMWTQRTLLARFQMNNTADPHTQMFRKPVYSAMAMLSLLGTQWLFLSYRPDSPGLSCMASQDIPRKQKRLAILLSANFDNLNTTEPKNMAVKLTIVLPHNAKYRGIQYLLNNKETNPSKLWKDANSPDYPSRELRRKIREVEEPRQRVLKYETNLTNNVIFMKLNLPVPSVMLINLCPQDVPPPGPASALRYLSITHSEILLLWEDKSIQSKCLRTYIVEYRQSSKNRFKRINEQRILSTSYHFDGCLYPKKDKCEEVGRSGWYRVAARDVWGRRGPYSNILRIGTGH